MSFRPLCTSLFYSSCFLFLSCFFSASSFDSFVISSSPFLFPLLFSVFFSCSISSVSQLLCCFLFCFLSPFPFSSPCQVFRLLTHFCSFSGLSFLIPYHCPIPFCVSIPISSSASSPVSSLVSFAIPSPVSSSVSSLLSSLVSFAVSLSHSFFLFLLICFLLPFLHLFSDPFPVCSTVSCNLYYIPNTSAVSSPVS